MEVTSKKYELNGKTYIFRPNFRAMIEFERIAEKPASLATTTEDNLLFLYCGTKAGMKKAKEKFTMDFEDFIDEVDGNFDILADLTEEPKKEKKK